MGLNKDGRGTVHLSDKGARVLGWGELFVEANFCLKHLLKFSILSHDPVDLLHTVRDCENCSFKEASEEG